MSDQGYRTSNLILRSHGVMARPTQDVPPDETFYLQMDSLEEIEESSLATRLGTTVVNKIGTTVNPLLNTAGANGVVNSLAKLAGPNYVVFGTVRTQAWRYAGVANVGQIHPGSLYRIQGTNPGAYSQIAANLSGKPWGSFVYSPMQASYPYIYIGDANRMMKDNGSLAAPQQMGIFQPQYPVQAQVQVCDEIILDPYTAAGGSYTETNVGGFTTNVAVVSTTLSTAVTVIGLQSVSVAASPNPITFFQSLVIDTGGGAETVLVLQVTATGFVGQFTKTHTVGATVVERGLTGTVAASTVATVSFAFSGTPISAWPTTLDEADYIGLSIYIGDPNAIQSITLQFNTANGAYFYRTIGQAAQQNALNAQTDSTTAASDAIISDSLDVYTPDAGGVTQLNTIAGWTSFLTQLSGFSGAGGADFNDPVMNWSNVTSYKVTIVTGAGIPTTSFPIAFKLGSLVLFGGAGPDSFAGVSYDYLFTYFNVNDFTESNPCMSMTAVNPPFNTNWVTPRRQPVLLTLTNGSSDTQITHLRIYRRGGTLGDNYRRIDQVPLTAALGASQTYLDIWSDAQIQQVDVISFTNDVPVTSPLQFPLANTSFNAINTTNQVITVTFGNSYGGTLLYTGTYPVSVGQQISIGNVLADNYETVIVLTIVRAGLHNPVVGFTAFVQNTHAAGETLSATAIYGQPVTIMAVAFDQGFYGGDSQNPNNLYWSAKGNVQSVSSAAYEPVSDPGDGITAIVGTSANLFVSTLLRWWSVAPGSNENSSPTIYPTQVDHGCVGQNAWTLRDGIVYYLALDGLRTFSGGGGEYISEIIEFVWQNTGPTPIPIADPTQFSSACVSWNNRWVFFSYVALDGNRHRVVLDCSYKRYRTDDLDCQSLYLEEDTGTLVWGDSQGLVHLDRQLVTYDEANNAGTVIQKPIAITLQTPYADQGAPQTQKNYNEFTLDADTNGNPVTVTLEFNDGEVSQTIGVVNTSQRQKVNLAINNGAGFQAYKVSMLLTGSGIQRIFLFQAKIRSILLGETRTSFDSYDLRLGEDGSKILKNIFVETTATAPITCNVYYDANSTAGFTFTIPANGGVRNALRVRLPAVSFRIVRFIFTSASDFILWETSKYEWKLQCAGKGYSVALLMP